MRLRLAWFPPVSKKIESIDHKTARVKMQKHSVTPGTDGDSDDSSTVSAVEVKARPAGAATGDVGSRAITGGNMTTISLDIVCMRIGNTERHPGTACTCVLSRPLERELCMGNGALCGGYLA